ATLFLTTFARVRLPITAPEESLFPEYFGNRLFIIVTGWHGRVFDLRHRNIRKIYLVFVSNQFHIICLGCNGSICKMWQKRVAWFFSSA
ncbi:MAG: hypothetical protein KH847_10515, partial [Clostridiales bacterium]|nr:hypothetical protein [Clostridiales bacterium]